MRKVLGVIWENWIKPLVVLAAIWAGFHYWFDFNNKQSIVFAVFFG
jgi:DMSO/TMAO reductase YedYZ heme-binding membrane subunit